MAEFNPASDGSIHSQPPDLSRAEVLMEVAHQLMAIEDHGALKRVLNEEHPADLADLMRLLDEEMRQAAFILLDEELAADVLAETDAHTTQVIAAETDNEVLSGLVEEMDPDDAADLLADMPESEAEEVLDLMDTEEAQEVQELMIHEEDTGGGLMTPEFIVAQQDTSVSEVVDKMRQEAEEADIFEVYIVDASGRLVGIVSVNRLVTARPETPISSLMEQDFHSVNVGTDQEDIAMLFTRYDLVSLPVLDEVGQLVGQIMIDDVVDVIHEEATEDIFKMAGTSSEQEMDHPSVFGVALARLPWLFFCLLGSFLSGMVIHAFDVTLEKVITLAAFIPVIMATGGNSGLQASTVTVRGLVTGQVTRSLLMRTVLREMGTATVVGIVCGVGASAVAWFWFGQSVVGLCVGISMFLVICLAVMLGVLAPLAFNRLGIDPAVASGPFITTTNDIFGLLIYLSIATALVQRFT